MQVQITPIGHVAAIYLPGTATLLLAADYSGPSNEYPTIYHQTAACCCRQPLPASSRETMNDYHLIV